MLLWANARSEYEKVRGHAEMLSILETTVSHIYSRLESMGMVLKQIVGTVTELQHLCLDMYAWLNYMTIYYPRFFPTAEQCKIHHDVDLTRMGAFTEEVSIADQLLMMGLPVWLIRPSFDILSTTNITCILKWEDTEKSPPSMVFANWEDQVGRAEPFPVLMRGMPVMICSV